eukprot:TRINITY_DN12381_c0_g1_i1.p1 TRINITY_DN12381_c0_g1~~TRINITY_DN12381_c0_g1_i1.p1  ORF type:complete len:456 (-),score=132.58 TRINITY_DN12381_c0_g1_i1:33-1325(-)
METLHDELQALQNQLQMVRTELADSTEFHEIESAARDERIGELEESSRVQQAKITQLEEQLAASALEVEKWRGEAMSAADVIFDLQASMEEATERAQTAMTTQQTDFEQETARHATTAANDSLRSENASLREQLAAVQAQLVEHQAQQAAVANEHVEEVASLRDDLTAAQQQLQDYVEASQLHLQHTTELQLAKETSLGELERECGNLREQLATCNGQLIEAKKTAETERERAQRLQARIRKGTGENHELLIAISRAEGCVEKLECALSSASTRATSLTAELQEQIVVSARQAERITLLEAELCEAIQSRDTLLAQLDVILLQAFTPSAQQEQLELEREAGCARATATQLSLQVTTLSAELANMKQTLAHTSLSGMEREVELNTELADARAALAAAQAGLKAVVAGLQDIAEENPDAAFALATLQVAMQD